MTNFEPITEERLASGDNIRVQVQLNDRREKILYGILHAAFTAKRQGLAAETRDSAGAAIIAAYITKARELGVQEEFKFILKAVIKELVPDAALAGEVLDILRTERILDQ